MGYEIWPNELTDCISFEECFQNIPLDGTDPKRFLYVFSNVSGYNPEGKEQNVLKMIETVMLIPFPCIISISWLLRKMLSGTNRLGIIVTETSLSKMTDLIKHAWVTSTRGVWVMIQ